MTPWQIMQTLRYKGTRDPLFDNVILLWNMRDTITTAPPLDQSKYGKVYTIYSGAPLYQTDTADSPFAGGACSKQIQDGSANFPKRASATDPAWDFASASQTLTMEGWVKVASVAGNGRCNIIRYIGSAGAGSDWVWPSFQNVSGTVRAGVDILGSTPIDVVAGVSTNTWFHFVLQYTATTIWLAVNGSRLGSFVTAGAVSNDMMLQMLGTTLGSLNGSGIYLGPQRVTLGPNRYTLNTNTTYTVPTDFFPTS